MLVELSKEELRLLRVTLIMEWEVKGGVRWVVDGVDVVELVARLERMMDEVMMAQLFTMSDENLIVGYQEMEDQVEGGRELVNGDGEMYVAYYKEIKRRGLLI